MFEGSDFAGFCTHLFTFSQPQDVSALSSQSILPSNTQTALSTQGMAVQYNSQFAGLPFASSNAGTETETTLLGLSQYTDTNQASSSRVTLIIKHLFKLLIYKLFASMSKSNFAHSYRTVGLFLISVAMPLLCFKLTLFGGIFDLAVVIILYLSKQQPSTRFKSSNKEVVLYGILTGTIIVVVSYFGFLILKVVLPSIFIGILALSIFCINSCAYSNER